MSTPKLFRLLLLTTILVGSIFCPATSPVQAASAPAISSLKIITPTLSKYDRFELQFNLKTSAAYLYMPFEMTRPAGLSKVTGVTVNAMFKSPSGKSYTQPAFYYQPYDYADIDEQDHFTPNGAPRWDVRFTPQETGTWRVSVKATDAGGSATSKTLSFKVSGVTSNPYAEHGFLRVSKTDPRYFEFQDGTTFIGAGYNDGFGQAGQSEQQMQMLEQNRMDFARTWLSGSGINGSQWTAFASNTLPNDGYLPGVAFATTDTYKGADLAFKIDNANPCLFDGWQQGPISVEPNTTYVVWARIKASNVGGDGFVIKNGGWLGPACSQVGQGSVITKPITGSTNWVEVSGKVTTSGGQNFLGNLYLALQGGSGQVLVDEVRMYKDSDAAKVNLLNETYANSHLYFKQIQSAKWDQIIDSAGQHGVYLKMVIDEKNEWIRDHLGKDGKITAQGDNNNFYAAAGTKVRWLEQAWWRYIIARWGYSTAIHSFEYVNEGDPYNGNIYQAANDMAKYFDTKDPAQHMVTTSFWHSFPGKEFWNNPSYSAIDYADLHAYSSSGWPDNNASFLGFFPASSVGYDGTNSAQVDGANNGKQTITPRGLTLHEKGEWTLRYWMKADNFSAACPYNTTGGMQRLRWMVDGGSYNGGKEGVVPPEKAGQDFICTSPGGSYDWKQFSSAKDRDGNAVPVKYHLVMADDKPHEIAIQIENTGSGGGSAYISNVELVSPSGKVVPVLGEFDNTSMSEDTAWYSAAYSLLLGPGSPVGVNKKPLVRGEAGLANDDQSSYNANLNRDQQGIWLHNDIWAGLNAGGMYDLFWWNTDIIDQNDTTGRTPGLNGIYARFRTFMDGIPLSNGSYKDAQAATSDANLRVYGQSDAKNGRAHLWIQNRQHTWTNVINGANISAISGQVTLPMPDGTYTVQWWNTYADSSPVMKTESVQASGGQLSLNLPEALQTDLAVKISR